MALKRIFRAVLSKLPIVLIVTIIFGAVGGYINYNVLPKKYSASATFYVLNMNYDIKDNKNYEGAATYSNLRTSSMLIDDYNVLATSKKVKDKVASNLNMKSLTSCKISISNASNTVENTRVMKMTVVCSDAKMAAEVANEMVTVFKETINEMMQTENIIPVDEATVPTKAISPAKEKNTVLCMAAGFLVSICIIVLIELLDNTVKTIEEAEALFDLPILAQIGHLRGTSEESHKDTDEKQKGKKRVKEK